MKRMKLMAVTVVFVVVLLIAEIIIVRSASKYEPQVEVVFAGTRIPENTVIQADMLKFKKVDVSMVHKQALRDFGELVGKKAGTDLEEGEMILSGRLGTGEEIEEIKLDNKDNRLFSVEFKNDQANGWWLKADQYVDIIFIPDKKSVSQEAAKGQPDGANGENGGILPPEPGVDVRRLRNIRVAALIDEKGNFIKDGERASTPRYVSFEVTDSQDEFLAYAKSNGRLEISVIP